MANTNKSNINVPEARAAMDKFKMEAASDLDVSSHLEKIHQDRVKSHGKEPTALRLAPFISRYARFCF